MTANELRQKYLEFFKEKGHQIIPSAGLIPENDPTVLFTTAGMHPLVPYLLGQKHPMGSRLADAQKCVRTGDIDDVGDNRHLTFFEMLGNWSLGDYFKREAIEWSWEFLTDKKWLGLDPKRLYATVFMGDKNSSQDQESIDIWREQFFKAGIEAEVCEYDAPISGNKNYRIFSLPAKDNWWGPAGQTGPCGPCTEMFYDTAPEKGDLQKTFDEEVNDFRIMEIWNDVFMEYNKKIINPPQPPFAKGGNEEEAVVKGGGQGEGVRYEFEKLAQKNVDTGMGLERTIAVLNGKDNSFDSDLFYPIINKIEELTGREYGEGKKKGLNFPSPLLKIRGGENKESDLKGGGISLGESEGVNPPQPSPQLRGRLFEKGGGETTRAMRIIADHIKAATFLLAEGLEPSNTERGYVLRRLIRRAVRYGKQLGINSIFTFKVADVVVEMYREVYPELYKSIKFIEEQLVREEEKFNQTLERGLREFERLIGAGLQNEKIKIENDSVKLKIISGEAVFNLYQSHGFPVELTQELAVEAGFTVDMGEFRRLLGQHQELSRAGAEQKFKGGLADHSGQTTKYHTATHLLLAALREVLDEHIFQKGSNITAERLRFDFSHPQKMTPEEITKVENLVNQKIQENLPVACEEMSLEEAQKKNAMGVFEHKYGERVKVYSIGGPSTSSGSPFSREICGGPHAERTGELGKFKIIKEEASSAGVRRIKAILK